MKYLRVSIEMVAPGWEHHGSLGVRSLEPRSLVG